MLGGTYPFKLNFSVALSDLGQWQIYLTYSLGVLLIYLLYWLAIYTQARVLYIIAVRFSVLSDTKLETFISFHQPSKGVSYGRSAWGVIRAR